MTNPIHITILHTNDMHGRLEAMGRLSTYAKQLKADLQTQGHQVFFMDAGDAADRRLGFCGVTKGEAYTPLLNAMGYDLQTLGNALSLTYGPRAISAYAARAAFPILVANVHDADGNLLPGLGDCVLLSLENDRKLGVIGLTVADFAFVYELFGLTLLDMVPLVREKAAALRAAGADVVMVLSHIGERKDRELAAAVPEIDLIIGGHSHTAMARGVTVNGVLIAQTGQYADNLGRVDLTLDMETGKLLDRSAELLPVPKDIVPDPALEAAIAVAEEEARVYRSRPLGELQQPLMLDHFAECDMGNWAADVLRERMGAEVAIVSGGLFHTGLEAGTVTLGDMDKACFSTANPQLSLVTGAQLKAALERGLDEELTHYYHHSHRGTPVGIPQISGLQVGFDLDEPVGKRVKLVIVNKQLLKEESEYRVAHTDAETSGEAGYLHIDPSQTIKTEVPTILREALEDDLKRCSPLPLPERGRWF